MFNIDFTFLFTAINLLILYFVAKKFLFGKLAGFMEARSNAIAEDIEKGESLKKEGEKLQKDHQELLSGTYEEKKKILEEARQQASKESDAIIKKAKQDAERIINDARDETERERAKVMKDLRRDVAGLAMAAATKIIRANMDNDKNRGLVDDFLKDEGAA